MSNLPQDPHEDDVEPIRVPDGWMISAWVFLVTGACLLGACVVLGIKSLLK